MINIKKEPAARRQKGADRTDCAQSFILGSNVPENVPETRDCVEFFTQVGFP
jgi:hypothetical protein